MGTKKNILFTFDYELYLGKRSGSIEKCIIEPTNLLINIFDEYAIKNAVFFVDTTYLIKLKEIETNAAKDDFKKIVAQLQILISKGHYVFPHLHPHWLDAEYLPEINQWNLFNTARYRYSNIAKTEQEQLFTKSIALLNEIILPIKSNYKINGYRAGGWCIQPFADFAPHFERLGVTNEFSVLRGMANDSDMQHFDFSNTPEKDIYHFSADPLVEDVNGKYREFVISVVDISPANQLLNKLLLKVLWRLNQRSYGDGIGAANSGGKNNTIQNELKEMVSVELLTDLRLPVYFNYIDKNDFIQFISHPKMLSNYNLKMLKKFLSKFTKRYEFETDFNKM